MRIVPPAPLEERTSFEHVSLPPLVTSGQKIAGTERFTMSLSDSSIEYAACLPSAAGRRIRSSMGIALSIADVLVLLAIVISASRWVWPS